MHDKYKLANTSPKRYRGAEFSYDWCVNILDGDEAGNSIHRWFLLAAGDPIWITNDLHWTDSYSAIFAPNLSAKKKENNFRREAILNDPIGAILAIAVSDILFKGAAHNMLLGSRHNGFFGCTVHYGFNSSV